MENNNIVDVNLLTDVLNKENKVRDYQSYKEKNNINAEEVKREFIKKNILILAEEYILPEEKQGNEMCSGCKKNIAKYLLNDNFLCEDCISALIGFNYKLGMGVPFKYDEDRPREQKPNDLCACGSGKKYKKCCKNKKQ